MSRNTNKITKAVKAKGWEVVSLSWSPIGQSCEMCGSDGGWFVEIECCDDEHEDHELVLGYNIGEVMEGIERLPNYSKAGDPHSQI